eukprot:7379712-Prymnesium_polylepis.1
MDDARWQHSSFARISICPAARRSVQGRVCCFNRLVFNRRVDLVPIQGGLVHRPALEWFESNEGVLRSWGGCLDPLLIAYSLALSGTWADSIARGCQRSIAS